MNEDPKCQAGVRQVKAGRPAAGSQHYRCPVCGSEYTPVRKARGYPPEVRAQAVRMYVDGGNQQRIARHLGVVHQTVANWVAAQPEQPSQPDGPVEVAELDELYTFVGDKKTRATS